MPAAAVAPQLPQQECQQGKPKIQARDTSPPAEVFSVSISESQVEASVAISLVSFVVR